MSSDTTHSLTLTRLFKAPPDRVFAAFASIDALKQWLGPESCGVTSGSMDFRVGGSYLMQMKTPMGDAELRGTFLEIDPPSRLVYTWQWDDDDAPETVISIDFVPAGNDTELRLTHTGFASDESKGNHGHGWTGSFEKLHALLAAG